MPQDKTNDRQDNGDDRRQDNTEMIRAWMNAPVERPFSSVQARERAARLIATTIRGPRGYYE